MSPDAELALCVGIAMTAHLTETVMGFGASLLALALGVHVLPLEALIPIVALLSFSQSLYLVTTQRGHIDRASLARVILPWAGVGLAVGLLARGELQPAGMRVILGVVPLAVAIAGGFSLLVSKRALVLPAWLGRTLLVGGGICQGLFAAGGPLVVSYAGSLVPDKHRRRATLAVLWLTANSVLLVNLLLTHRLVLVPARLAAFAVGAILGVLLGEAVHRRIGVASFAHLTWLVLLGAGAVILA